jgi:hypothetical protein
VGLSALLPRLSRGGSARVSRDYEIGEAALARPRRASIIRLPRHLAFNITFGKDECHGTRRGTTRPPRRPPERAPHAGTEVRGSHLLSGRMTGIAQVDSRLRGGIRSP